MGGMFNKPDEMPGPPMWLYYISVPDVTSAVDKVKELGGQVVNGPMEVPGGDLIAQCLDTQGARVHVDVAGGEKFRVIDTQVQADQLLTGDIETLAAEPSQALPPEYDYMATILKDLLPKINPLYESREFHLEDAAWVGGRFAELLPLHTEDKQAMLELDDPHERLRLLDHSFLALQRQQSANDDKG